MTGNNRRRALGCGFAAALLAASSQAQTPGPTAPALPSPSSAPAVIAGPAPTPVAPLSPVLAQPQLTLNLGHFTTSESRLTAEDARLNYGDMLFINAPRLTGDPLESVYDFTGGVSAHANDTTINAADLKYGNGLLTAKGATVTRRPFTVRGPLIVFTQTGLTASHASITTAPPGEKPDIELRAAQIKVTPVLTKKGVDTGLDHIDLRDVALYLLHKRLLTVRHFATNVGRAPGTQNRQQGPRPTVGYSGRFGPFVGYGSFTKIDGSVVRYSTAIPLHNTPQVDISSVQTLISGPRIQPQTPLPVPDRSNPLTELRLLTAIPPHLLPAGDSLLFHDFLPGGNLIPLFSQPARGTINLSEEVSYHIPTEGNGLDDLYVTRFPEINLSGSTPITRAYALPAPDNPVTFREYLRRVVVYAGANVDAGKFDEQPTDVNAGRLQTSAQLYTRPILVAPNTVLAPSVSYTDNRYTGHQASYKYSQYSVALSHFYSPYSAFSLRYIGSAVSGSSPFNFDTLNSTSELDARIQFGSSRVAYATGISYDLVHAHVIDYTLSVAPALHGFTPVFSYQFFSRSVGLGFTIPGLTF